MRRLLTPTDAEKKKVGAYFSTPIYAFRCKCHLCDHWFEIRTDPQNTRYVVHEGARQQWDPDEGDLPTFETDLTRDGLDPLEAVEKEKKDKAAAMSAAGRMAALADLNEDRWSDPYENSKKLRDAFRTDKSTRQAQQKKDDQLRDRLGLSQQLVLDVEGEQDIRHASSAWQRQQNDARRRSDPERAKRRRLEAEVGPSAGPSRASALPSTTAASLASRILTTSRHGTDAFLRPNPSSHKPTLGVRRPV